MKLILKDKAKVTIFANIFHNLKNILDDANISFMPTHLYMQGMDGTHALLVELKIESEWFDEYEVGTNDTFGLHCETFYKIINCLKEDQYIELTLEPADDKMCISFQGGDTIAKEFQLSRIDMDVELMEIPDVEYQADICIKSKEFSEIMKELVIFNDTVQVRCTDEQIELLASGILGSMKASIKETDIITYAIEEDTTLELNYALNFLDKVCHFHKIAQDLYIHCSIEYPMKLHYSLVDEPEEEEEEDNEENMSKVDINKSFCRFFIAPKVDE